MANQHKVVLLPGDGIGPEVTRAAAQVLTAAAELFDIPLETEEHLVGWAAVGEAGDPLPPETLAACRGARAVFLGAVGHPDADGEPPERRPETGLLALRTELGCYANLRPLRVTAATSGASPLRPERVRGTDMMIVRELGGGLYYGTPRELSLTPPRSAFNTLRYSEDEIRRIAAMGFEVAARRRRRLVSVDKANVLETSRLWRTVVEEVAQEHPKVEWSHMLVDRAAMELVLHPTRFDVILTSNLFGDILSDEMAGIAGTLGLLPSASLGGPTPLFEPVHGSAPDLVGQGKANPVGAILSGSLLLDHGLARPDAARAVERAVEEVMAAGIRTPDLAEAGGSEAPAPVDTATFTGEVITRLREQDSRSPARAAASSSNASPHHNHPRGEG